MSLLYDEPIKNIEQDLFYRKEFVKDFVQNILSIPEGKNMTISINGEWGSGKTSLINLIKDELSIAAKEKILKDKEFVYYQKIDFAPWNTLNEDAIINQFFKTLISNFAEEKINKIIKSDSYNEIMSILEEIPKFGKAFKIINKLLKKYSKSFLNGTEDLLEIKDKINKKLQKTSFKFIVFIDDIDRLNNKEIKLLIQLIKAVCDFPNIIYILSFDKKIVANALSNEQAVNGFEYMEKIIQLSIDVPSIENNVLYDYLLDKMNSILLDATNIEFDSYRWGHIFHSGFFKYFKTLRNVNRYINIISFKKERYLKVLDSIDFVTLEAISLFEPELLSLIDKNRELLCHDRADEKLKPTLEAFQKSVDNISDNFKLLTYIFPVLQNQRIGYYSESKTYNQKKILGRVSVKEYLDFYFNGILDRNCVSKLDLVMYNSFNDSKDRIKYLEKYNNKSFNDFLRLLYGFVENHTNLKDLSPQFLFDVIEGAKEFKDITKMFHPRNDMWICEILDKLLLAYNDEQLSMLLLDDLYKNNNNYLSLISILYHLAVNTKLYNNTIIEEKDGVINKNNIMILHNILVDRLKEYIYQEDHLNDNKLVYIIHFMNIQNSDIIKKWFEFICKVGKINVIIDKFYFTGYGESNKRFLTYYFNFKDCEKYIDIESIKNSIKTKLIGTQIDASIGEVLFLMPQPKNNENYEIVELQSFCKENKILFTAQDELIYE